MEALREASNLQLLGSELEMINHVHKDGTRYELKTTSGASGEALGKADLQLHRPHDRRLGLSLCISQDFLSYCPGCKTVFHISTTLEDAQEWVKSGESTTASLQHF